MSMNQLKQDALDIVQSAIQTVLPDAAVKKALDGKTFSGKVIVISIGKAAWTMANAAVQVLGDSVTKGVVLTKYGHSMGKIPHCTVLEAGHPVLDENTLLGTQAVLQAVEGLSEEDTVIFLISGGGSALFELPEAGISLADLQDVSRQLLASGADIVAFNTIRKRLSSVKGGKFGAICAPAKVLAIALSDILGDRPDAIASGPAYPDATTCADALAIVEKYHLSFPPHVMAQLSKETPKEVPNCQTLITGSVSQLCAAAAQKAASLGYTPMILSTLLDCEAKEAGAFLGSIGLTIQKEHAPLAPPCALICGGETIVRLTGKGKGGRNQEMALSAAKTIAGTEGIVVACAGSDGTDGPTDAAGGITDGTTLQKLSDLGISIDQILQDNDSNAALAAVDSLIITGPTGTNVNDLYLLLCK